MIVMLTLPLEKSLIIFVHLVITKTGVENGITRLFYLVKIIIKKFVTIQIGINCRFF